MTTVRAAEQTDEAELFRLVALFPTPTPPSMAIFAQVLMSKLADDSACVLVAVRDGKLVGYLSGYAHQTFYANGPTAWVDEVLVLEGERMAGCGRQLMAAFEDWARSRGCVLVSLATRGAAPFYERLGYATKAAYYKRYLTEPTAS
jgi:GNAT superfamily N-acetyltransferase